VIKLYPRVRHAHVTLVLCMILVASISCSDGSGIQVIQLEASDFQFQPARITVREGRRIRIVVTNTSKQPHSFASGISSDDVTPAGGSEVSRMQPQPAKAYVLVDGSSSASVTFTAILHGVYPFWCAIPTHREAGMEGFITVEEPGMEPSKPVTSAGFQDEPWWLRFIQRLRRT
jgi:uncharacterized cupredoxin-like copper-binding protein